MTSISVVSHNFRKDEEQLCVSLEKNKYEPMIQIISLNCWSGLFHDGEAIIGQFKGNDFSFGSKVTGAEACVCLFERGSD